LVKATVNYYIVLLVFLTTAFNELNDFLHLPHFYKESQAYCPVLKFTIIRGGNKMQMPQIKIRYV